MGIFDKLFKSQIDVDDSDIVALADGKLIDVCEVSDPMFAEKILGDSIAFKFEGNNVEICSPVNGNLTVLFPTGHAFGVTNKQGVEILIHIGVNTVETKGKHFKIGKFKQGDEVKAGQSIVTVDFDELSKNYDTSTMLIITNSNNQEINFVEDYNYVKKLQSIIKKS